MSLAHSQMVADEYQIYEAGGISHLAPDYEKLVRIGAKGLIKEIEQQQTENTDADKEIYYRSAKIMANGLIDFAQRYSELATKMISLEENPVRQSELREIATICENVPCNGAQTFYEAVQSIFLAHIAIFQESMGESICPGRIDQILYPYYKNDLGNGLIDRQKAKEILGSLCIKMSETIPVFSDILTKTVGGMTSYQVITVGGVDEEGNDAVNELSYILIELFDELRMREPNFHIRVSQVMPKKFHDAIIRINTGKGSSPALFNDEVIIKAMTSVGYSLPDARNYVAIGCVEPTSPGKTLGSTDAAIINLPLALELALNQGKRFNSRRRTGKNTQAVSSMTSINDVREAYEQQLDHQLNKLIKDLKAVERVHSQSFPTPLTSMLIDGSITKGLCTTKGSATYNFSGIQGVGISTVGDSLYAIEQFVFSDKRISLKALVDELKHNFKDEVLHARLSRIAKFGNDHSQSDEWTRYVAEHYVGSISKLGLNTRGGQYIAGIYSNTTHVHFGEFVGATANGRKAGKPFASGMAPENGADMSGPTALINSMNRLDFTKFVNGITFNFKCDSSTFHDESGRKALESILAVYFKRGGMQIQVNMLDPTLLLAARENPELYPNLLVRVSGYSSYFNDLSPEMKDEIISRSMNAA
jgi:formate C-acetyltransferase